MLIVHTYLAVFTLFDCFTNLADFRNLVVFTNFVGPGIISMKTRSKQQRNTPNLGKGSKKRGKVLGS